MVAADLDDANQDRTGSNLMVWHVSSTGASPFLVADGDVAVPSFSVPPAIPQPAGTDTIDPLDARLTQAVAATDPGLTGSPEAVWTQHTVSDGASGAAVAWYELVPATLTLDPSGRIATSGVTVGTAAIAPTGNGGAVIDYNTGGSGQNVDIEANSGARATPRGR